MSAHRCDDPTPMNGERMWPTTSTYEGRPPPSFPPTSLPSLPPSPSLPFPPSLSITPFPSLPFHHSLPLPLSPSLHSPPSPFHHAPPLPLPSSPFITPPSPSSPLPLVLNVVKHIIVVYLLNTLQFSLFKSKYHMVKVGLSHMTSGSSCDFP